MVYHHAQHSRESSTNLSYYTKSGLVPCGRTPPFSLRDSCDSSVAILFDFFDFLTFQHSYQPTLILQPSYHLILIGRRSSLAMPHLILRSHYSQVFYVVAAAYYRCRQIVIPEKKSWRSAAPQHRNTAPVPINHHQRHRRHDDW